MNEQLTFVIVEDNELDAEKIERGFKRLKINNPTVRAKDGVEALSLLRGNDAAKPLKRPYVVLLDMNMPRMNGVEFLAEIRSDAALANTPVFVLTTSERKADVDAAYQHNVAGYIVKPVRRDDMIAALEMLDAYWELCVFPEGGA